MTSVDFASHYYYPCIQSSDAELLALRNLSLDDRASLMPIIEISQPKTEASVEDAIAAIKSSCGGEPFILDLSKDGAPQAYVAKKNPDHNKIAQIQKKQDAYNTKLSKLLTPDDGFSAWREVASQFPNAVPCIQYTDPVAQSKNILRQVVKLSNGGSDCICLRITQDTNPHIYEIIGQIVAVLDSPNKILFILDCGQARQQVHDRADFARKSIARIIEETDPAKIPYITAVCISDFFTTPPDSDGVRYYENCSWDLWQEASENRSLLFGDYCGHRRFKKQTTFMPGEWRARVVFPLDEAWLVYRDPNSQDADGWIKGAQAIASNEEHFDAIPDCWGGEIFDRATKGDISEAHSARFWDAAKINMHIHRQIRYAENVLNDDGLG